MTYPILVERFDSRTATAAVCERCHQEITWDPAEGDPYDLCITHQVPKTAGGTDFCGGQIVMKYDEGQRCKGCGKLDFSMPTPDGCCSRVCSLQAEYAANLAVSRDFDETGGGR